MDVAFEILVPPETNMTGLNFQKVDFQWRGQAYPQGLPQCAFGEHFILIETPLPNHIKRFLPNPLAQIEWRCISVKGDGLDLFKLSRDCDNVEWHGKGLSELFNALLCEAAQWVVVFEVNCDRIDSVVQCELVDLMPLLDSSLTKNEGFVAINRV